MSDRLAELLSAANIENELDRKHWQGVRDQYRQLDALLERLPERRIHQAMVPLSKVAFCPGRLVHTNEVMVLLGDKYFAKTSVSTARQIVESRTKQIEARLEKNEIAGRQITERGETIGEEFNDDDLIKEEWDEEQDKLIDQQRRAKRPDEATIELMRREQQKKALGSVEKKKKETKSVKFNAISQIDDEVILDNEDDSEPEEPLKCSIKWSKMSRRAYSNDQNVYQTPWDIGNNYQLRCEQRKRSILKATQPVQSKPVQVKAAVKTPPPPPPKDVSVGAVMERSNSGGTSGDIILPPQKTPVTTTTTTTKSTAKRVSLFKQKRLAQK